MSTIYFQSYPDDYHEELCHICDDIGELILCDTCSFAYHLQCINLKEIPPGTWFCPKCEVDIFNLFTLSCMHIFNLNVKTFDKA